MQCNMCSGLMNGCNCERTVQSFPSRPSSSVLLLLTAELFWLHSFLSKRSWLSHNIPSNMWVKLAWSASEFRLCIQARRSVCRVLRNSIKAFPRIWRTWGPSDPKRFCGQFEAICLLCCESVKHTFVKELTQIWLCQVWKKNPKHKTVHIKVLRWNHNRSNSI